MHVLFRKLQGHRSCVNALAFSSGDGQWLASGGDGWLFRSNIAMLALITHKDLAVQLYDFHQQDIKKPSCSFLGHRVNSPFKYAHGS